MVGEGGEHSEPGEGSARHTNTVTPHPALRATLSHKGRGYSSALLQRCALSSLNFQTAKHHHPCCLRRGSACIAPPPENPRERSAGRRTKGPHLSAWGVSAKRRRAFRRSACGAHHSHRANGSAPGPRFLGRGLMRPVPVQQAPCRAVIVPPGRVPKPLECVVTSHTREDRIPSRYQNVS